MVVEAIQELLYRFNCVVVPNFGGIISHTSPAVIHPVKNTFSPPNKRLAFNENLKENDGLLVSHLTKKHLISTVEAELLISKFIHTIKERIDKEGMFDLPKVGVFTYNTERRLQFKPNISINYLEDSFGLPELYFKPIEQNKTKAMDTNPSPSPRGPIKKEELEEVQEEGSKKSVFLVLPVVLMILMIGALFLLKDHEGDVLMATVFPSLKSDVELSTDSTEELAAEEEMVVEDVVNDENHWGVDHSSNDTDLGTTEEPVVESQENVNGVFHVIAGVFSKKSYAKRLASQYDGEVLELNGYFKVSVGRYNSKDAASQRRESLVNELGNDIWILTQ